MVFISHAFALALLAILAAVGKIDGFLWFALGGVAVCVAVDAIMWLRAWAEARKMSEQMVEIASGAGESGGANNQERLAYCLGRLRSAEANLAAERQRTAGLEGNNAALQAKLQATQAENTALSEKFEKGDAVLRKAHTVCAKLSAEAQNLATLVTEVNQGVAVQRDRLNETGGAMDTVSQGAHESSMRVREISENAQTALSLIHI